MTPYLWWGLAIAAIAFLVWIVTFAFRAGGNSKSVQTSEHTAADAEVVAAVQANMARAQAEGPQDKAELLARLDAGTG